MGGCATKPKVLQASKEAPAPTPAPPAAAVPSDPKDVVVVQGAGGGGDDRLQQAKEIVEDDKADIEEGNKRRSLSRLFKENEEESKENDKIASQPLKEEIVLVDTEKATSSQPAQVENSREIIIESATERPQVNLVAEKNSNASEFVDALEKIESKKIVESGGEQNTRST